MVKKCIPFWFFDVIKTECTLEKLSGEGLYVTGFSPVSGVFTLKEGEKRAVRYRICRGEAMPKGLTASGWRQAAAKGKYYIAVNDDPDISAVPDYRSWKTANRLVLFALFLLFCCTFGFCLGAVLGSDGLVLSEFHPEFAGAVIISLVTAVIFVYFFTVNRKLAKYEKNLGLTGVGAIKTIPKENFIYTPEEEKRMKKSGEMIQKTPIGWFYAPDKAEEMVEKMAREGFKFYRFNPLGTVFYFIKSEPCRLRFVVDYQNEASDEYFAAALDDGWKLEFTSAVRMGSFIVWSKQYCEGEEVPEFYSDKADTVSRARRTALVMGFPMVVFAALFVVFAVTIPGMSGDTPDEVGIMLCIAYLIIAVEYSVFGIKSIGYYRRIRKKYSDKF